MAAENVLIPRGNLLPLGSDRTLYGGHPYVVGRDVDPEVAQRVVDAGKGDYAGKTELTAMAVSAGIELESAKNKGEVLDALIQKEAI